MSKQNTSTHLPSFEAGRFLFVLFASASLLGCAVPGSLMNVKDAKRGNYAYQLDFGNLQECNAMADRLESFFRKQADARVAGYTVRFAECTGMSISDRLIYQGIAEIPGIAKPVRLHSHSRVLCEDAAAVLGIKYLRTTDCSTQPSLDLNIGPLLQIKEAGLGTVLAELPMRTTDDCMDIQMWALPYPRPPFSHLMFWCMLEQAESPHLEQQILVQRKPDRFNEGRVKMRVLDQRRCRELERLELPKAIHFEIIESCMPVAKSR